MAGSSETDQPQCMSCPVRFTRSQHLGGHVISHYGNRPFSCSFCPLGFKRRDALLRHLRICKERISLGLHIPKLKHQKRGRKRSSCHQCVQQKKKCSRNQPCDSCIRTNQKCCYDLISQESCPPQEQRPPPGNHEVTDPEPSTLSADKGDLSWFDFADLEALADAGSSMSKSPVDDADITFSIQDSLFAELEPASNFPTNRPEIHFDPLLNVAMCTSRLRPLTQLYCKFEFLANFTTTNQFAKAFDCGNSTERKQIMQALSTKQDSLLAQHAISMFPSVLNARHDANIDFTELNTFQEKGIFSSGSHFAEPNSQHDSFHSRYKDGHRIGGSARPTLAIKSQEIVLSIWDFTKGLPNSSYLASRDKESCCVFFSSNNLRKYLHAFWSIWYPNWPVFHKPKFIAAQKPASLIASLALIGAVLSPDKEDHDQALKWLPAVEKWVFSVLELHEDPSTHRSDNRSDQTESHLDSLRAAYAIVIIMTFAGTCKQKKKARRYRFAQIVTMTRGLLSSPVTHGNLQTYTGCKDVMESWRRFILKEELIRTILYVHLLDCAYVMFHNCTPRLVMMELQFSLACPEICFQELDVCNWLLQVQIWAESEIGKTQPLMVDVLESIIITDKILDEQWTSLFQMSSLNFFAVASAFHSLIFYQRSGTANVSNLGPILRGLENWKRAWLLRKPVLGDYEVFRVSPYDSWKRIGFMRHALEYWAVAWIMANQIPTLQHPTDESGYDARRGALKGTVINFDDSEMKQFRNLIVQFDGVNLD